MDGQLMRLTILYHIVYKHKHYRITDRLKKKKLLKYLMIIKLWEKPKKQSKAKKQRRYWVRPVFSVESRHAQGAHDNLLAEMKLTDTEKYFNYLRMTPDAFEDLLQLIGPTINKIYLIREPINASTRLALTLRYLASGDSMVSIAYAFRVGINTVSTIIPETCLAIWQSLKDKVFLTPSEEAWKQVSAGFQKWNFPNCIGSLDGKHVVIQAPSHSGSSYYNYKGSHSMVLLALCDASYCFTIVDIGAYGRQSDGGILRNSKMGKAFEQGLLKWPPPSNVPNGPELPYVIVADEAFALTTYMLRPYPKSALTYKQKVFNYRLSRTRRVIESSFGILSGRWRIYRKPIIACEDTVNKIIQATVTLHNYLIRRELCNKPYRLQYLTLDDTILRQPSEAFYSGGMRGSNNYSKSAARVRDIFADYFFNKGAVDFQWRKAFQN